MRVNDLLLRDALPRILQTASLSLFVLALFGCGGDRVDRLVCSGTVTLDGERLQSGNLTLRPLDGGLSAGGTIAEGRFEITADSGPTAGLYRVEIVSYQPTGEIVEDPDLPGEQVEAMRQVIPARYNTQSDLTVEVTSEGENDFAFELTSQR